MASSNEEAMLPPFLLEPVEEERAREAWSRLVGDLPFGFEEAGSGKDSRAEAMELLSHILHPVSLREYYEQYYEQKPLLIQRSTRPPKAPHYHGLFSQDDLRAVLEHQMPTRGGEGGEAEAEDESVCYTRDLDVTNYLDGKRVTLNPKPRHLQTLQDDDDDDDDDDSNHDEEELDASRQFVRVDALKVWRHYEEGCSLRLKTVQSYSLRVCRMLCLLEELWGSGGGANVYLTPDDSQGFAPHYDDVEVYVCQLEGAKRWRVYAGRSPDEFLDRYSSPNFSRDELPGAPILEATLRAGDVLVLPRGTIHEARSVPDAHSLHITFSAGYHSAVADFLQHALPAAVEKAARSHVEMRRSVPMDLFDFAGRCPSRPDPHRAEQFAARVRALLPLVTASLSVDTGADLMARAFLHGRLPPLSAPSRTPLSSLESSSPGSLTASSRVRLARRQLVRVVEEDGVLRMYYSAENSSRYLSRPAQFIEIDPSTLPVLQQLLSSFPAYARVSDLALPGASTCDKLELAQVLSSFNLLSIWKKS